MSSKLVLMRRSGQGFVITLPDQPPLFLQLSIESKRIRACFHTHGPFNIARHEIADPDDQFIYDEVFNED